MITKTLRKPLALTLALAMIFAFAVMTPSFAADPTEYDMSVGQTQQQSVAGAIWQQFPSGGNAGTGNFNTYLMIQAPGNSTVERGYNSDRKPLEFDEKQPNTKSLPLAVVPLVQLTEGGPLYREFVVDLNQSTNEPFISLDEFQVWQTNLANLSGYNEANRSFPSGASKIYDMDEAGNVYLKLDYRIDAGSGKHDYRVLILNSLFDQSKEYVTLFVRHGDFYASNSGFEEWGVRPLTTGSVYGLKFNDVNNNGTQDIGEPGMAGWKIFVDYNDNGDWDEGEPYAVTSSDGTYVIAGVTAGTFKVKEVQQNGWAQTKPVSPNYYSVDFSAGSMAGPMDFGNYLLPTVGQITITKELDGDWELVPEVPDFVIRVKGDDYEVEKTFNEGNGWTQTWEDLLPGEYTVEEVNLPTEWDPPVYDPEGPYNVVAGETVNITVTNSYTYIEQESFGSLKVTKYFDGDYEEVDPLPAFYIKITKGDWSDTKELNIGNGFEYIWDKLEPGDYEVEEINLPDENWAVDYGWEGPVTVEKDLETAITLTNSYDKVDEEALGSLTVRKVVAGDTSGLQLEPFSIRITGPEEFDETVFLSNGEHHTFLDLPAGTYFVDEAYPGSAWQVTGQGEYIVVDDADTEAVITNTYTPPTPSLGTLQVTKKVVGYDGEPMKFEIVVTGPNYQAGATIGHNEIATFFNLEPGTYTVTEVKTGLSEEWTVTGEGSFGVTAGNTVYVTVTNTYEEEEIPDTGGDTSMMVYAAMALAGLGTLLRRKKK
jgi:LPXTG-motif cell wall-anchored protein